MTILDKIINIFKEERRELTIKEIAEAYPEKPESTLRARIYENKDKFERVGRGVYVLKEQHKGGEVQVALIQGNGRDLSMIPDNSIDAIVTDHPWADPKSNKGGDRNFDNTYDTFRYTIEDLIGDQLGDDGGNFLRLGRSLIINTDYIYLIDVAKQQLVLSDCKGSWHELTASREVLTKLKAYIESLMRVEHD